MKKLPTMFIPTVPTSESNDLSFVCPENCGGEDLIAELYGTGLVDDIDDITLLFTVSTGSEVGRNKGDLIEMTLDFTGVHAGNYYCKVYTAETGVLARTIVVVQ